MRPAARHHAYRGPRLLFLSCQAAKKARRRGYSFGRKKKALTPRVVAVTGNLQYF
jgi:hypothetical protein